MNLWRFISTVAVGLLTVALTACDQSKPDAPPASPKVSVGQPLEQRVPEWEELTGRFEVVETHHSPQASMQDPLLAVRPRPTGKGVFA